RLAVRADQMSEPVGDARQRTRLLAVAQQLVRAECPGGDHDPTGADRAPLLADPGARPLGDELVATRAVGATERLDVDHRALGLHLHAELLGEPQVVLAQRVLRAVTAADHALAAAHAAGAARPLAAEVGVVDLLALRAEVDPHARVGPRV